MYQVLKQEIAAFSQQSYKSETKTIRAFLSPINTCQNNHKTTVIPTWDQHGTIIVTLAFGHHRSHMQQRHSSKSESDFMSAPNTLPEDDVVASAVTAISSCCEALNTPYVAGGPENPVEEALNKLRGRHYFSERPGALTCTIRHDMVYRPDDHVIIPLKFHDTATSPHPVSFIPAGIRYQCMNNKAEDSGNPRLYFSLLSKDAEIVQSIQSTSQANDTLRSVINIAVALSPKPLKPYRLNSKLEDTSEFAWLDEQLASSEKARYSLDKLQEMLRHLRKSIAEVNMNEAIANLTPDSPWTIRPLTEKGPVTVCQLSLDSASIPPSLLVDFSTWRNQGEPTILGTLKNLLSTQRGYPNLYLLGPHVHDQRVSEGQAQSKDDEDTVNIAVACGEAWHTFSLYRPKAHGSDYSIPHDKVNASLFDSISSLQDIIHDPATAMKTLLSSTGEEAKRLEETVGEWIKKFNLSSSSGMVGHYGRQKRGRSSVLLLRFPYQILASDEKESNECEMSWDEYLAYDRFWNNPGSSP